MITRASAQGTTSQSTKCSDPKPYKATSQATKWPPTDRNFYISWSRPALIQRLNEKLGVADKYGTYSKAVLVDRLLQIEAGTLKGRNAGNNSSDKTLMSGQRDQTAEEVTSVALSTTKRQRRKKNNVTDNDEDESKNSNTDELSNDSQPVEQRKQRSVNCLEGHQHVEVSMKEAPGLRGKGVVTPKKGNKKKPREHVVAICNGYAHTQRIYEIPVTPYIERRQEEQAAEAAMETSPLPLSTHIKQSSPEVAVEPTSSPGRSQEAPPEITSAGVSAESKQQLPSVDVEGTMSAIGSQEPAMSLMSAEKGQLIRAEREQQQCLEATSSIVVSTERRHQPSESSSFIQLAEGALSSTPFLFLAGAFSAERRQQLAQAAVEAARVMLSGKEQRVLVTPLLLSAGKEQETGILSAEKRQQEAAPVALSPFREVTLPLLTQQQAEAVQTPVEKEQPMGATSKAAPVVLSAGIEQPMDVASGSRSAVLSTERGQPTEVSHEDPPVILSAGRRQRKQQNPVRLGPPKPIATRGKQRKQLTPCRVPPPLEDRFVDRTCVNVACKAHIKDGEPFCKRCSCCICKEFDENKDPSLWIECPGCSLSCHVCCAMDAKCAGVIKQGDVIQLDASYSCASCGYISGLFDCWRKQMNAANGARRIEALRTRLLIAYRLFKGSVRYKGLHNIVAEAANALESEIGPVSSLPARLVRGLVTRLTCGNRVMGLIQKACFESCRDWPCGETQQIFVRRGGSLERAYTVKIERVTEDCVEVSWTGSEKILGEEVVGHNIYIRASEAIIFPKSPAYTAVVNETRAVLTGLHPGLEYLMRICPYTTCGEVGHVETKFCTPSINHDMEFLREIDRKFSGGEYSIGHKIYMVGNTVVIPPTEESSQQPTQERTEAAYDLNFPVAGIAMTDNQALTTERTEDTMVDSEDQVATTAREVEAVTIVIGEDQEMTEATFEEVPVKHQGICYFHEAEMNEAQEASVAKPDNQEIAVTPQDAPLVDNDSQGRNTPTRQEAQIINLNSQGSTLTRQEAPIIDLNSQDDAGDMQIKDIRVVSEDFEGVRAKGGEGTRTNGKRAGNAAEDSRKRAKVTEKKGKPKGEGKGKRSRVEEETTLEVCVKRIVYLEREGHLPTKFRMKMLTWLGTSATEDEKKIVFAFVKMLANDPQALATQLIDTFNEILYMKGITV